MESPFSRGKSFGKVLAYLDARVPVIASAAGEHGAFFTPQTGVVSNDTALWIDAACRLLNDGASREQQAAAAFDAYRQQLSTEAATKRLAHILSSVAEIEHQLT
jgi:glycosyltransferase involved in cell wall biosynthesis